MNAKDYNMFNITPYTLTVGQRVFTTQVAQAHFVKNMPGTAEPGGLGNFSPPIFPKT